MAEVRHNDSEDCSLTFKGIVNQLSPSRSSRVPYSPCADQMVGAIRCFKDKKRFDFTIREPIECGKRTPPLTPPTEQVVLVILESPHVDEFDNGSPIGPACGCTGCRIRKHFSQIFGDEYDDCALVLLNAFRFQCSLGLSDVNLKNRIIRACKKEAVFKDNLKSRINDVMERFLVRVFVNASGCVCEGFVDEVLNELEVEEKMVKRIRHPSRWNKTTTCKSN